ncbi:maleylpyruvate isomerase N-terminal domain-containing protein [Solibacillus sp. FSL K6-1523]|uniref:maleylpyruvate isomerase N-terminal domain-containing protein n=1 Tax=Solibacillus sp. FSL K6-1523 TaxID=2921471 RepID=UPI0030FAAE9C
MLLAKELVIVHIENSIDWIESLIELNEKDWRKTVGLSKWSVAEVVGHFKAWDEFVINQRVPYLFQQADLPKAPDTNSLNNESAKNARENTKAFIIEEFVNARKRLIKTLSELKDEFWEAEFMLGSSKLMLPSYFHGLKEHDLQHFLQIAEVVDAEWLKNKLNKMI